MKTSLKGYQGLLSAAQIAAGMNAAAENAIRLVKDANVLLNARRFPTAASIAILAIEEIGKTVILKSLALARSKDEATKEWKKYHSHTQKNMAWALPQFLEKGSRTLDLLLPLFEKNSEHPLFLNQLKQSGFYTDCLGNACWSIPAEAIGEGFARSIVQIAELFAHHRTYTEMEIELWCEHIGPVWKSNYALLKTALFNWFKAMQKAGLIDEDKKGMEEFSDFLFGFQKKSQINKENMGTKNGLIV